MCAERNVIPLKCSQGACSRDLPACQALCSLALALALSSLCNSLLLLFPCVLIRLDRILFYKCFRLQLLYVFSECLSEQTQQSAFVGATDRSGTEQARRRAGHTRSFIHRHHLCGQQIPSGVNKP